MPKEYMICHLEYRCTESNPACHTLAGKHNCDHAFPHPRTPKCDISPYCKVCEIQEETFTMKDFEI